MVRPRGLFQSGANHKPEPAETLNRRQPPVRGWTTKLESATMTGSVAVETGGLVEKRPNWATVRGYWRAHVNYWAETVRPKVGGSAEATGRTRLRRGGARGGKGGETARFLFFIEV